MHARPFYATSECLVVTLYLDSSISNSLLLLYCLMLVECTLLD